MDDKPSFVFAMRNALKLEGESTLEFGRQVIALSPADKQWYFAALQAAGIDCYPPAEKKAA